MSRSRVFSIPPGAPFLPTLVQALAEGRLIQGPLEDATLYVPTRRAARALSALLAERAGGRPQLLPRIVPLGEAEEAAFDLVALEDGSLGPDVLHPSIPPLERRLILTRLVQTWSAQVDRNLLRLGPGIPFLVPASPADAVGLAGDLEALLDAFTTEEVPWEALATAVDSDYSRYFEITRDFVRIVAETWPQILAERKASDPARRRDLLLVAEAQRLARERPQAPIVAAGSTGSMPATAALLAAIARLPNGAVVLPGLDTDLDEASWRAIGGDPDGFDPVHGHPQAMLHRLLDRSMRIERSEVAILGTPVPDAVARQRLLSEALRPADTTHLWAAMAPGVRRSLSESGTRGLSVVEAADEREEALAIALALRETLEEPGLTAALVTPDRGLAARVAAELARWDVSVEDSAGIPLAETAIGRLARLAADAVALDFPPVRVLALLAHPAVRLGWRRETVERAAGALEIGALRGPAPRPGLAGLRDALALRRVEGGRRVPRPRRRIGAAEWDLAAALIDRLEMAFAPFAALDPQERNLDLVTLAAMHRAVVDRLTSPGDDGEVPGEDDGSREALASLFDELSLAAVEGLGGRLGDYPAFFTALAKERVLRPTLRASHRRVKILGLLEARLLHVDRVVLGGLDEGTWPPRVETDAFLNRPMRARVGLTPPERRIGQTAHDFVQALGCADAVITRAQKRDSAPTVPSRLLQRLKAFVGDEVWSGMLAAGARYRTLARLVDEPRAAPKPLARPAPKPDPILIPRSLSVTQVETLVRDPYAIFARHVLKLDPLDAIAVVPSAADRGTLVHDVLGRFAAEAPVALPSRPLEILLQLGQDAFQPLADVYPELYADWWPRFERIAGAFAQWEETRRGALARVHAEVPGSWTMTLADGSAFTLTARADRIEALRDGGFAIVDFKTGAVPSVKEVYAGFAPQLTLEAAMLMHGAFRDLPRAKDAPALLYVHATGGRKPLEERPLDKPAGEERSVAALAVEHPMRLQGLLTRFLSGEAGFVSRPYAKYASRFGAYDHLARVKEWSLARGEGEGA